MTQPLVKLSPDSWGLRQSKIGFPTEQIGAQLLHNLDHAATSDAAG